MYKILYAASRNQNSKLQLARFIEAIKDKPYLIKVAAYKDFCPNIHIDWTLDALAIMSNKYEIHTGSYNYSYITYVDQIKYFKPDLIISDLEFFTSYAANLLNITLWQCSPSIVNFAFTKKQKYNMSIFKQFSYVFNRNPNHVQRLINILDNSNRKLVYSHLGDFESPPEIQESFQWVRPYHKVGKNSITCQHNIMVASLKNNKDILKKVINDNDVVYFSENTEENYNNITFKNIYDEQEYYCNLKNSNIFVCEGQTTFLSDSFYNGKKPFIVTDYDDPECLINSAISEKLDFNNDFNSSSTSNHYMPTLKPSINFLDEEIDIFFDLKKD
jgi:uncharacterized protein (TIGR00661 family)